MAYVEIASATRNVGDVKNETALATTTVGPGGLISALQNERNDASAKILGQSDVLDISVEGTADARKQTDQALEQFRGVLEGRDRLAVDAYGDAFRELDRLDEIRTIVDDVEGPKSIQNINDAATVFSQYTAVINPLLDANSDVRLSIDDAELRNGAELLDQVSRLTESVARLNREVVFQLQSEGMTSTARAILVSDLVADYDTYMEGIRVQAKGPYRDAALAVVQQLPGFAASRRIPFREGRQPDRPVPCPQTPSDRTSALRYTPPDRRQPAKCANETVDSQTHLVGVPPGPWRFHHHAGARRSPPAGQSPTRPRMRRGASRAVQTILDTPLGEDVRMPEVPPIKVRTRDEVADVAESLNTVQQRTLSLAVEQAVLRRNISDSFVNLGRRTQNLIGRQLDFITTLEHEESDPDVLDNLFKLDHLATRVRRNAESLVVLAGLDTARSWSAPVSMGDVIRRQR